VIVHLVLSSVAATAGGPIWFEAEDFTRSNWPGGRAGTGFFAPEDATQAAKLSGGKWLNTGNPTKRLFAEYKLTVPAGTACTPGDSGATGRSGGVSTRASGAMSPAICP